MYPMAWHGMALKFLPMTIYPVKYSVSNYGILETFHARMKDKSRRFFLCRVIVKSFHHGLIRIIAFVIFGCIKSRAGL